MKAQNLICQEVAVFVVSEREKLDGHQKYEEQVSMQTRATEEKSEPNEGDKTYEKKDEKSLDANASEKEKPDEEN